MEWDLNSSLHSKGTSTYIGLSRVDSGLLSGLSGGLHVLYEE